MSFARAIRVPILITGIFSLCSGDLPAQESSIGVNLAGDWLWTDAIRQARPHWDTASSLGDGAATEDSNHWPTEDCSLVVWEGHAFNDGTYALSFNGEATISISYGYGTVNGASSSQGTYNANTNTTTATVVITDTMAENCSLIFTGTQRSASSASNTGITNVHLYRPIAEGATTSYSPGTLFTNQTIAMSQHFAVTRFMDQLGVINSTVTNWADRPLPGAFNQSPMAYEYVVAYGNAVNTDVYINIPLYATSTFITNLANLIKYGSDGVNPYTSAQANPVYAPLNPGLHVYLELSNEVWNGGFAETNENYNIVVADQKANNAEWGILNFDGAAASNLWTGAWRRIIYQSKLISDDFRAVFGNAAMPPNANATVRPLIEFQAGNGQATGSTELQFLDDYFNNSDGAQHVTAPQPVSYFLWGGGGATYYNSNDDTASTVDALFGSGIPDKGYPAMVQADVALTKAYGIKRVAYEGGWGVYNGTNGFSSTAGTAAALAKFDARATTAETTGHTIFQQSGGDLNIFYTSSSWAPTYIWSLTDAIFNLSRPLFQAATNIDSSQAPAVTYGNAISATAPTTLTYGSQLFAESVYNSGLPNNGALGFVPLISTGGNYQIALQINSPDSGKFVRVLVDGQTMAGGVVSVPVASSPVNVVVGTVTLGPGQHGLIVEGQYTSWNNYTGNSCNFTSVSLNLIPAPVVFPAATPTIGIAGTAYSFTFAATGSPTPTFTLTGGSLPPGLTLSASGAVTGTPTGTGTFSGTVTASNGRGSQVSQNFTITISGGLEETPTLPPWALVTLMVAVFCVSARVLGSARAG
jgi:hypothetical protein